MLALLRNLAKPSALQRGSPRILSWTSFRRLRLSYNLNSCLGADDPHVTNHDALGECSASDLGEGGSPAPPWIWNFETLLQLVTAFGDTDERCVLRANLRFCERNRGKSIRYRTRLFETKLNLRAIMIRHDVS